MRSLTNALFLAHRYLWANRLRTAVLVGATSVCFFLPAFTWQAATMVDAQLSARGDSSPVLVGYKGNEFDLTMSSLYFQGSVDDPVPHALVTEIVDAGYGVAVPLYVGYTAAGIPLVGTSLSYFEQRGLEVVDGRLPAMLGEVVVGAEIAADAHIAPGDKLMTDHSNLYNIAEAYPLVCNVVGVLGPTGTVDDHALFADVKTTWVLDGHLHGHGQVTKELALNPDDETENLEASAAIFIFNEITDDNVGSYHFHGEMADAPLSAVLVFPADHRAKSQLLGDYALSDTHQALQPSEVIDTILGIVLQVRDALQAYFALILLSTVAFFVLVMALSMRLRAAEIALMERIGCSRSAIAINVGTEITLILIASVAVAAALTAGSLAALSSIVAI